MEKSSGLSVFLFDIDGVLVDPLGYRACVQATLSHFARQMGLSDHWMPEEDVLAFYEANRITSEWDMVPLILAILMDHLLLACPGLDLPATLSQTCSYLRQLKPACDIVGELDFRAPILRLGPWLEPGEFPAEVALRLATHPPQGLPRIFPHLGSHPLLRDLLAHTREVERSYTTRIFQHFSLGSQFFQSTYNLPPEIETPSLLVQWDKPQLTAALRDNLLSRHVRRELALAAYTMRPSLPPRELLGSHPGFAPEAEMALQLVNLSDIPLIGYGHIRYLADLTGEKPEGFLKPSPVQALAAILAAIFEDELQSLNAAVDLYRGKPSSLLPRLELHQPLRVNVFEDSVRGIEAAQKAIQLLQAQRISVHLRAWGTAAHPEKITALQKTGTPVFTRTEDAIQAALQEL